MSLKGAAKRLYKPATTLSELTQLYHKFEGDRAAKSSQMFGREVKPNSFLDFVADKIDLCPHSLITPNSAYWTETISLCDSDMGLHLPGPIDEVPAVFFDALSIIRSARALAKKETNNGR